MYTMVVARERDPDVRVSWQWHMHGMRRRMMLRTRADVGCERRTKEQQRGEQSRQQKERETIILHPIPDTTQPP